MKLGAAKFAKNYTIINRKRQATNQKIFFQQIPTAYEENPMVPTILRRTELEQRLGLSRSSIYKMMDDGEFPRPFKIGRRAVGWREEDIETWLMAMQGESDND